MEKIQVMKALKYYNFDIIGLSKFNIHWTLVKSEDSWEERIIGYWEARNSVMACNLEEYTTKVWQP